MKKFSTIVLILLVLMVSSCATLKKDSVAVNVSGKGVVYLKADMVSFQVQVDENGDTTGIAQQRANKKTSEILSILRSFYIKDDDITTTSLNFSTEYEWNSELQKSVRVGERVSQTVVVKMRDIDNFGKLVDSLGSNITGIRLSSVSFDASDHSEALVKARELAYADALAKAETYAKSAGYKTVVPVSIVDGYYNVNTRAGSNGGVMLTSAKASMDEAYGTETPVGNLCVTVEAEVQFTVK